MNEIGLKTAKEVAANYFGILLTDKWITDHIDRLNKYFPQNRGYAFTFAGECESESLSDTSPRECFMDGIAYVMTGRTWPILCDRSQYDEFFTEFKEAINNSVGISLIGDNK